jgi:hypothetical protein
MSNHIVKRYEALSDFVRDAQRQPLNGLASSRGTDEPDWSGTKTFEDAVKLAVEGWPKGRENLMDAMAQAASMPSMTPSFTMDVAGAYPIAAIAAAGDPCSMVDLSPVEDRVRPIVRLVVCRNGSASYSAKDFLNYGAAVLSYIEGLEAAGFRVEIEMAFVGQYSDGSCSKHYMGVIVKRAEDHLELDKLAFCLTHVAMFRRLGFAVKESTPGVWEQLGGSYGYGRNPEPGIDTEPGQIIIPSIQVANPGSKELKTPQAALEKFGPMIEKQLSEAGLAPPPLVFGEHPDAKAA